MSDDAAPVFALDDVLVERNGHAALAVGALDVREGEVLAVIGPNGAGKSTLLRVLALLEPPARGTVRFRGGAPRTPAERLAVRRRTAMVFQDALLCDTTVTANVRLPLTFRGVPRAEADRRVGPWLERLGIAHLAARSARTLSGGEAQRASLARAFALEPEALLLDEPFAALDAPTREALLDDLVRLLGEARTTTVFVTHERGEALRLGDRVAVLLDGRLAQLGPPGEVFGAPADDAVARFVGVENLLAGRVAAAHDGLVDVGAGGHTLTVVGSAAVDTPVLVGIRPEDVVLEPCDPGPPTSARNRLPGTVTRLTPLGAVCRVQVACGVPLVVVVTRPSVETLALAPGVAVTASFKATAARLVRARPAEPRGGSSA
jgi:tungstate transport system ATP-binding protein